MLGGPRWSRVAASWRSTTNDGLISYQRGHMKILDRAGLEAASCECYRIVRSEFERLLGVGRG